MLVPVVLNESTSPSPAKVPPVILTVPLTRFGLSKSVTVILGEIVVVLPWVKLSVGATEVRNGGSSAILIVVFCGLDELAPSLTVHVTVRVGLELLLLGFTPEEKVTLSSTA